MSVLKTALMNPGSSVQLPARMPGIHTCRETRSFSLSLCEATCGEALGLRAQLYS